MGSSADPRTPPSELKPFPIPEVLKGADISHSKELGTGIHIALAVTLVPTNRQVNKKYARGGLDRKSAPGAAYRGPVITPGSEDSPAAICYSTIYVFEETSSLSTRPHDHEGGCLRPPSHRRLSVCRHTLRRAALLPY